MNNEHLQQLGQKLHNFKQIGQNQWYAICPCHDDKKPSLSISLGNDNRILMKCHAGCKTEDICRSLSISMSDLFDPNQVKKKTPDSMTHDTYYNYLNEDGKLMYQVCRMGDKRFFQRQPDGQSGWLNHLRGVTSILYQLPKLKEANVKDYIFIPEGEKDVNRLLKEGFNATCNSGGAGKWDKIADLYPLLGYRIVILPDNDQPGREHAKQVAESLHEIASELKILHLPDLKEKGDVSDWLDSGNTVFDLLQLADQAENLVGKDLTNHPAWQPQFAESEMGMANMENQTTAKDTIPISTSQAEAATQHGNKQVGQAMPDGFDGDGDCKIENRGRHCQAGPDLQTQDNENLDIDEVMPYKAFPTDLLPYPLNDFVNQTATSIGCDPSYVALPMLSSLASAIGNTRRLQIRDGWHEPAVLWTAIIGESGSSKSPALDAVLKPIFDKQNDAINSFRLLLEAYQTELQLQKNSKNKNQTKPTQPICQRYLCNDTTIEALAVLLENSPRGLLLCRDELSGWLSSFNQYKSGKGGDVSHWLSLYNASLLIVDRKTGDQPMTSVPRAAVNLTGGIQPAILKRTLTQEYFENGLAARLLMAMPPRTPKQWQKEEVDIKVQQDLIRLFQQLYQLDFDPRKTGQHCPIDLTLSTKATNQFIEFYNQHNEAQMTLEGNEAALWSKLEGCAGRLALILHCVRLAAKDKSLLCEEVVDDISVNSAIKLVRWFGYEAFRIYNVIDKTDDFSSTRCTIENVKRYGSSVSLRDYYRGQNITKKQALEDLNILVRQGLGEWEYDRENGRREIKTFKLTLKSNSSNIIKFPTLYDTNSNSNPESRKVSVSYCQPEKSEQEPNSPTTNRTDNNESKLSHPEVQGQPPSKLLFNDLKREFEDYS